VFDMGRKKFDLDEYIWRVHNLMNTGHARYLAATCQRGLEMLRPMPVAFESIYDLMLHLFELDEATFLIGATAKNADDIQLIRIQARQMIVQEFEKTRSKIFEKEEMIAMTKSSLRFLPIEFRLSTTSISCEAEHLVPVRNARWLQKILRRDEQPDTFNEFVLYTDQVIAETLGHGDVRAGWKRAWAMASEGAAGGIRALRHRVLSASIHTLVELEEEVVWQDMRRLPNDISAYVTALVHTYVSTSGIFNRNISLEEVSEHWDQVVRTYLRLTTDHITPRQLG